MGSVSIFPVLPAQAKSDSKSRWRICRSAEVLRSTMQCRKEKTTNCFSPFHRTRANDCKLRGTRNFPTYRSRASAPSIENRKLKIENCRVATFISNSPAETEAVGRRFAKDLVAALGSGATITSPTFTIVHEYPGGRLPVYHFDFFRLEDRQSIARLGLDDYFFGDGISVIEWADRFPEFIPEQARWISFEIKSENTRAISLK